MCTTEHGCQCKIRSQDKIAELQPALDPNCRNDPSQCSIESWDLHIVESGIALSRTQIITMHALRKGAARLTPNRAHCFQTTKRFASGAGASGWNPSHGVDESLGVRNLRSIQFGRIWNWWGLSLSIGFC